jgi:hypothetical protein
MQHLEGAQARAVHVLALVHWIGGVAIVTTIFLPRVSKLPDADDSPKQWADR